MKTRTVKFLEWAQMATGCTAAAIVSFNIGDSWVFFAMCLFALKDTMMGLFAYIQKYPGIIVSSAIYVPIDLIGVWRWWPF